MRIKLIEELRMAASAELYQLPESVSISAAD